MFVASLKIHHDPLVGQLLDMPLFIYKLSVSWPEGSRNEELFAEFGEESVEFGGRGWGEYGEGVCEVISMPETVETIKI